MGGWVKLYRELFRKPIWLQSTPEQASILIALLSMANHAENEWEWNGKQFKAIPGQFVTSAASIMKNCPKGTSRQNVRSALERFKKYDFLTCETTKTGMLITIVNWRVYQTGDEEPNQETNQGVTKRQPTPNQGATTNKKDKECIKNDKKIIVSSKRPEVVQITEHVFLTPTEINKLKTEFSLAGFDRIVEIIDSYKANTPIKCFGSKAYKDDNLVIHNWVIERYKEEVKKLNDGTNRQSAGKIQSAVSCGPFDPSRIRKAGS